MKKNLYFALLVSLMWGCTTPKQMTLFADGADSSDAPMVPSYIIDPGDVLQITFSTITGEGANPYNSAGTSYIVRNDSTIVIPVLGSVVVAGKTTEELTNHLEELVKEQLKQPLIKVEITSATISILGEVASPSRLDARHPIRLTEALSMVGGPTKYARLDNILVQRNEHGHIQNYRIDLTKDNLAQSPCYYLQKGDVLYIAPRIAK